MVDGSLEFSGWIQGLVNDNYLVGGVNFMVGWISVLKIGYKRKMNPTFSQEFCRMRMDFL